MAPQGPQGRPQGLPVPSDTLGGPESACAAPGSRERASASLPISPKAWETRRRSRRPEASSRFGGQDEADGRPRAGRRPCVPARAPSGARPPRSPPPCPRRPGSRSRRAARDRRPGCAARAGKGVRTWKGCARGARLAGLHRPAPASRTARRVPRRCSTPPLRLLLRTGHRAAKFAAPPCAGGPLPARARGRARAHVREVRFCHRTRGRVRHEAIGDLVRPRRPPLRAPRAHAPPPPVGLGRCAAAEGATP